MTISSQHAVQLGDLMCEVTEENLWRAFAGWVAEKSPGSHLRCRVGSGQATYHRFDPRNCEHQITFGKRMIAAKHHAEAASGWLSGREIRQRGYFEGEVTTLNLLAHTCCHEFAHLLQQVSGKRFRGSVHNRHFYSLLDDLHHSGRADDARASLSERARLSGLALPDDKLPLPDPVALAARWQKGDQVSFGEGLRQRQGTVRQVNRKTCTVDATGRHRGTRYRVPITLLRAFAG